MSLRVILLANESISANFNSIPKDFYYQFSQKLGKNSFQFDNRIPILKTIRNTESNLMMLATLTRRSYQKATDRSSISALVNICAAYDRLDQDVSLAEFQLILNSPDLERHCDTYFIENYNGKLIGLALIEHQESTTQIDGNLWIFVHPDVRHQGLETELIQWSEKHLQRLGRQKHRPVRLLTDSRDDQVDRAVLFNQQGFQIKREFLTLERSLNQPLPLPELSQGFQLSYLKNPDQIPAWVEMYNQSFVDHWNHYDISVETVKYWHTLPDYQPELDIIAIAPDGTFAALCSCRLKPQPHRNIHTGWIEWLGTRRGFRRMGLGRAMLFAGMRQLQQIGADTVKLSVDSQSLTGANHLYESVGFRPVETVLSWVKPVAA